MNRETIKAIERATNSKVSIFTKVKKWYGSYGYILWRVVLFPIWLGTICYDKIIQWFNKKTVWTSKRAQEILDYYVPRRSQWDSIANSFYFYDNGYGWHIAHAKRYLKRKDYRFWKKYRHEIRNYLINSFELEGFNKTVNSSWFEETEIEFTAIEQ